MVAGHLREKRGYYHIILSYTDEKGNRQTPSKGTGLTVKGNKKRAEAMLLVARQEMEVELAKRILQSPLTLIDPKEVAFTVFMLDWLEMMKAKVELTTYSAYCNCIKKRINPYFDEFHPGLKLKNVQPKHIQDYYTYEMKERGVSPNTVIHRHANIRKALQYAFKTGLIDSNPADRIERPKKTDYQADYYNEQELLELFDGVKSDPIELGVTLAAFYGLRRSEAVGLKWNAINFENKTVTIRHVVTEANIDGKSVIVEKDRTKTKKSHRTLPLVAPFEELLHRLKAQQNENRSLCGEVYNKDDAEYIYVNELGERIKPAYLTTHFPIVLGRIGMRRIRFHDLRHSCASLLYANGVSIKEIQEWLGHSNISTTANIYTHLDFTSKVASANAILGVYPAEGHSEGHGKSSERIGA
ncbi:MAG: site-specific integrase [Oscillospiraceae bacterium]|jgi:integrase|nr:site-specific integrase [Oscillospiraceae bacterium]